MINNGIKLLLVSFLIFAASCGDFGIEDNPAIDDKVEKFLGTWSVSDQPARLNYTVKIERSPINADEYVILNNFGDLGGSAVGLVVQNTIVIDNQGIGNGFKAEGSGNYLSEKKMEFEFFLDDGIEKELRKATFTK
jgi:hypothetical protein